MTRSREELLARKAILQSKKGVLQTAISRIKNLGSSNQAAGGGVNPLGEDASHVFTNPPRFVEPTVSPTTTPDSGTIIVPPMATPTGPTTPSPTPPVPAAAAPTGPATSPVPKTPATPPAPAASPSAPTHTPAPATPASGPGTPPAPSTPATAPTTPAGPTGPTGPTVLPSPEMMQVEQDLIEARNEYARAFNHFYPDRKSRKNPPSPELQALESRYNDAIAAYGTEMLEEKTRELSARNPVMTHAEMDAEIQQYTSNEIFTRVIIEEDALLKGSKAENLPPQEKSLWRHVGEWYLNQKWYTKVAISSVMVTGTLTAASLAFVPGAVASTATVAGFSVIKLGRGLLGGAVGQMSAKAYDYLIKDKSPEERKRAEKGLATTFSQFVGDIEDIKKSYAEIQEKEKKAQLRRLRTKALIAVATGAGTSILAGNILNSLNLSSSLPVEIEARGNTPTAQTPNTEEQLRSVREQLEKQMSGQGAGNQASPGANIGANTSAAPSITPEAFKPVSVEITGGKGGLQAILDLKEKLNKEYPDISKAPQSVKDFLKGNFRDQAIKAGLFDPDKIKESAMLRSGSSITLNEKGEILFTNTSGDQTVGFKGDMFDSDKGRVSVNPTEPEQPVGAPKPPESTTTGRNAWDLSPELEAKYKTTTPTTPEAPTTTTEGEVPIPQRPKAPYIHVDDITDKTPKNTNAVFGTFEGPQAGQPLSENIGGTNVNYGFGPQNPFLNVRGLSPEMIEQTFETRNFLFERLANGLDRSEFRGFMNLKAEDILDKNKFNDPEHSVLKMLMEDIREESGVYPRHGLFNLRAYSVRDYIEKGLEKIAQKKGSAGLEYIRNFFEK